VKKTTIIIVVVILLIVLVGGAFFLLGKSHTNPVKSVQTQMTKMSTEHKSLADFFSMTGSQKCTFSDKSNNSSGTLYIGDSKMRGDLQTADNGKTATTHMINDGSYVYIWTDGQKDGYKMSTATIKKEAAQVSMSPESNAPSEAQPSSGPVNMNQKADYSCGPWSVDSSMFAVPQNVTFTDYSSMMQGITPGAAMKSQGMTDQQKQSMCAQCNKVPAGAMRNQCLSQLKCQ
jgi:hypothetical protein